MTPRTTNDILREEYFSLLPNIRLTAMEIEAEVRHLLVPLTRRLEGHERIIVKSRIKECDSAIAALQRRSNWQDASAAKIPIRSLRALNDLAGIRVLAFPRRRVLEVDAAIRERFGDWIADPIPPVAGSAESIARKYHGFCSDHCRVRAEIQVLSLLVGLFWEVEHSTLYKPGPQLRGVEHSLELQSSYADVIRALEEFELEVENQVQSRPRPTEERVT